MKVFGIGLNKTGTTTLGKAIEILGFKNHIGYNSGPLVKLAIPNLNQGILKQLVRMFAIRKREIQEIYGFLRTTENSKNSFRLWWNVDDCWWMGDRLIFACGDQRASGHRNRRTEEGPTPIEKVSECLDLEICGFRHIL